MGCPADAPESPALLGGRLRGRSTTRCSRSSPSDWNHELVERAASTTGTPWIVAPFRELAEAGVLSPQRAILETEPGPTDDDDDPDPTPDETWPCQGVDCTAIELRMAQLMSEYAAWATLLESQRWEYKSLWQAMTEFTDRGVDELRIRARMLEIAQEFYSLYVWWLGCCSE